MGKLVWGLLAIIVLSACGTENENSTAEEVDGELIEETYSREITEEEQEYIQLIINEEYEKVKNELYELDADNPLKDYYSIAMAFLNQEEYLDSNYSENLNIDTENHSDVNEFKQAYLKIEFTLLNLDRVDDVPEGLKSKVDELRNWANEKMALFTPIYKEVNEEIDARNAELEQYERKKVFNEKVNEVTDNPQPVSIGMTQEEVLTEGWGKPIDINKTTTAYGTSEQWVYDGYKYLYFEDGILTTIKD